MSGIVKALTCVLGVLAVVACLATVGIVGYSMTNTENNQTETAQNRETPLPTEIPAVPTAMPDVSPTPEDTRTPAPVIQEMMNLSNHVHDYEESVEKKATCYSAGKIKYACECGDTYYVDIMSTGHVPDDWEIVRKPTEEQEGLRVQKCIYCDEIVAQESIPLEREDGEGGIDENHVHQYTASTEREPSCTLAGLRKYTCSCGDFYTEMIPAPGHVATDWTTAEEATTTHMGTEQRTCTVCGVVMDSRPVNMLSPSPAASSSNNSNNNDNNNNNNNNNSSPAASGAATASPAATPSAVPSATPHTHSYQSYVLKTANCTEVGIRSFVCTCGSSYAETIERDLNSHTYRSMVVPPTQTSQGYTVYTCVRCNYSYMDNYLPATGIR